MTTTLHQAVRRRLRDLALTLRPGTVCQYRHVCQSFLDYIQAAYPEVRQPSHLRRRPHMVGWLRSLVQHQPPLAASTRTAYIILVRRMLTDIVPETLGEPLFMRGDLPPQDTYLPKPLSPEDDWLLQQQLRKEDTLCSNAFLLLRLTGLRIGECRALHTDSLQHLGGSDWALRVPLGKLHNDRWVPVDEEVRQVFDRILQLRTRTDRERPGVLLAQRRGRIPVYWTMSRKLREAAQRAGCSQRVTPHRLRHTFATSMLRNGVSLLALKEMLGHRSIAMTMRYVLVSQVDMQREYHKARQNMALRYCLPKIALPTSGTHAIGQTIADAKNLIEMLRRDLQDVTAQRKLRRLTQRLTTIAHELSQLRIS